MRVGTELREWFQDREAQHRSRAAADAFASHWNDGPVNRLFREAMARIPDRSAESVAAAVWALFKDDQAIDTLVDDLAKAMQGDPFFEPPFRHLNSEIHGGLIIFEDENVSIAAGVTSVARVAEKKRRRSGGSIGFSGQVDLFKFVKAGGARLSLWEAPRIGADFTAAQAGRCRQTGEREIEDGEILIVDGRCQSFIVEHLSANLVVLQATVKPDRATVAVQYEQASGQYLGCSAADDSASRIQMITTLLRKLEWTAAFPIVAEFVGHPNFFVRWHVMRELLGLDAEAALPYLRRMAASDPHSETRRAARTVLDRLERPQTGSRRAA